MSYLSLVVALINLARRHPEIFARLWAAIQDGYQASLDAIDIFKSEFPGVPVPRDGENDTLCTEEVELASEISKLGHRSFGGNIKKVVAWVLAHPEMLTYVKYIIETFGK
jgi:hypothetical protein